jgi:hypothetical protein
MAKDDLTEFLSWLDERPPESQHSHLRWWYRGQANADWELVPGVYRDAFKCATEEERLLKERHLCQDFGVEAAGVMSVAGDAETYFLQQHFRLPTRLLDWTTNPLTALFFAATSHGDADGAVFEIDAYGFPPAQVSAMGFFKGIATTRSPVFQEALWPIFHWRDPGYFPKCIVPVRPPLASVRVVQQQGCFTFHGPATPKLTKSLNHTLRSVTVGKAKKDAVTQRLRQFGIDEFHVYRDLENLATRLRRGHDC